MNILNTQHRNFEKTFDYLGPPKDRESSNQVLD
jgi:hypothetical protein